MCFILYSHRYITHARPTAHRNHRWLPFVYWLAVALVLIPSPLLEFRYFILPFVMLRVHVVEYAGSSVRKLAVESLVYLAVNAIALYVFLYRPFVNGDDVGIWFQSAVQQRFIW